MGRLKSNYRMNTRHRPSRVFTKAFNDQFIDQMDEVFFEELKAVQQQAMQGKLNPKNKDIFIQWKDLYPSRFQRFCHCLSDMNRIKLQHFLDLDDRME